MFKFSKVLSHLKVLLRSAFRFDLKLNNLRAQDFT